MNKKIALLFSLIIITAMAITPCCMALQYPSPGTNLGPFSGLEYGEPSIIFSPTNGSSWSGYFVGDTERGGWPIYQGGSSPNGIFLYNSTNLTLGFTASTTEAWGALSSNQIESLLTVAVLTYVSYSASWLQQPVVLYSEDLNSSNISTFSYNLNLTNIPEGQQQITVTANEEGYIVGFTSNGTVYWPFSTTTSSAVFSFSVITFSASFISPVEGQIFNSSGIPLNFNINGQPSWLKVPLTILPKMEWSKIPQNTISTALEIRL